MNDTNRMKLFNVTINYFRNHGMDAYNNYKKIKGSLPKGTIWRRNNNRLSSIQEYTGIAWGQSQLEASPLTMARVAGTVGNNGIFVPTRYLMNSRPQEGIQIIDSESSVKLASAMNEESQRWIGRFIPTTLIKDELIGGKTGTPERFYNDKKSNDSWYICYLKSIIDNQENVYAVAIRLERWKDRNSRDAVDLLGRLVIPALVNNNYIKF